MESHYKYEIQVKQYFEKRGYRASNTPNQDYGVDVFAEKGNQKLAVQAKMFSGTNRKVNRKTIMELFGASRYFDCTGSVLVTSGKVLPDAIEVADKLNVEIIYLPINFNAVPKLGKQKAIPSSDFSRIWEKEITPLQGKIIPLLSRGQNRIIKVDSSGLTRESSNGRQSRVDIEIFQFAINRILKEGKISRSEINDHYEKRGSSIVAAVLCQCPSFEQVGTSSIIRLKPQGARRY